MTYQTSQTVDKQHDEIMSINEQRLAVEKETLEYQRQQDNLARNERETSNWERQELTRKIEELERRLEEELRSQDGSNVQTQPKLYRLKGSNRNKPCACGSGIKGKKCHPNGLVYNGI